MKLDYLGMDGVVETLTMKEIERRSGKKISWDAMHLINGHRCNSLRNEEIYRFLMKYLGEVTVFSFNNMCEWGYVQLYPAQVKTAIANGAIDKRCEV